MARLELELVPSTSWGDNVRSRLSRQDWDTIRQACYKAAGWRCEICSGIGTKHRVEAHEIWSYDDVAHTQTLVRTIALCPRCHQAKHIGRTLSVCGPETQDAVLAHIKQVNGWTDEELLAALDAAFDLHARRSQYHWAVDISWIDRILGGQS